jgi:hypothetical protein
MLWEMGHESALFAMKFAILPKNPQIDGTGFG